ncbi:MAG: ABC transporter permease subunit [Prolixibacteraceae bacterium]
MNKNLFIKDLHNNLFSFIIWTFVITFLVILTMSVFPTFIENQSKILGMMNLVPKAALQFKGISNINDMLSVLGFYAANNITYMMLLGSIFAIVLSSNILLKEEYQKTAEYLLTRPLTRSEIFLSKVAVVNFYILLLNIVITTVGFIAIEVVKNGTFSIKAFLILSFYTFLLNSLFGAIGIFISNLVKRPKPITTFSIGLVLIFYFISTLSKITPSAATIAYLSPFKYVNIDVIRPGYQLELINLFIFIGFTLILTGLALQMYKRKDIYL